MKRKKTQRIFTPAESYRHLAMKLYEHADNIAFAWPTASGVEEMTYQEFVDLARSVAAGLSDIGLAGKHIAIVGETSVEWLACYYGIALSGGVIIPMDKELQIDEMEHFFEIAEAEAVCFSATFNQKFQHLAKEHATIRQLIPFAPGDTVFTKEKRVLSFTELVAVGKPKFESFTLAERDPNGLAELLFTSGTTGTSKCVMLSEKNIMTALNAACECVEFSPYDTIVSVLPLHHTYELCCMLAGMNYGMKIALNDSIRHVMRNFNTFKPTGLVLVPLFVSTIYKRIWDEARKKGQDKILLRAINYSRTMRKVGIDLRKKLFKDVRSAFGGELVKIVCGGAPLNPKLVRDFEEFGVYIAEGYGITECSPLLACNPYFDPKPGSVGPAVRGCTIRIDGGQINDLGFQEGEICAKGDNVMLGYYKNEEATKEAFTPDGWFKTGDIGYLDNDGYVFITGRKKYVIVLENGKNVFPEEIEEYLARVEGVCESVVLGRRAPGRDEIILTAIIYPSVDDFPAGTSVEEIQSTIRNRIGQMNKNLVAYKQIRSVEFRDKEFEKTTSRKIKRQLIQ